MIRKGEMVLPKGNTVLQPADEMLALVGSGSVGALAALFSPTVRSMRSS